MSDVLEYPYKAKPAVMLACAGFFGLCAAGMAHAALTNDRGLIINGLITLEQGGATVFYWCVAAVSVLFVIGGLMAVVQSFRNPGTIRLTATELVAPKNAFARKPTSIPLKEIVDVGIMTIQKQRFLTVHHRGGKIDLSQSMLPNKEAFEKLHDALIAAVNRVHAPRLASKAAA